MSPDFDEGEEAWLSALAAECLCCGCCWDKPCGGCQAGGVCDAMPCNRDLRDDDTSEPLGGYDSDEDDGYDANDGSEGGT
jgi:hypothetical protein